MTSSSLNQKMSSLPLFDTWISNLEWISNLDPNYSNSKWYIQKSLISDPKAYVSLKKAHFIDITSFRMQNDGSDTKSKATWNGHNSFWPRRFHWDLTCQWCCTLVNSQADPWRQRLHLLQFFPDISKCWCISAELKEAYMGVAKRGLISTIPVEMEDPFTKISQNFFSFLTQIKQRGYVIATIQALSFSFFPPFSTPLVCVCSPVLLEFPNHPQEFPNLPTPMMQNMSLTEFPLRGT